MDGERSARERYESWNFDDDSEVFHESRDASERHLRLHRENTTAVAGVRGRVWSQGTLTEGVESKKSTRKLWRTCQQLSRFDVLFSFTFWPQTPFFVPFFSTSWPRSPVTVFGTFIRVWLAITLLVMADGDLVYSSGKDIEKFERRASHSLPSFIRLLYPTWSAYGGWWAVLQCGP